MYKSVLFICFNFGATPTDAQGSLLMGSHMWVPGMILGLDEYKAITVLPVLLLCPCKYVS